MKIALFLSTFIVCLVNAQEPRWLLDPSMKGKYIGAIGCAKEQKDMKNQEKIALLRAKGAISQQIATTIQDTSHQESNFEDDIFEEEFSFQTKQESTTSFTIMQMASYLYENRLLCVWVVKK